jgi:hypothetical protein
MKKNVYMVVDTETVSLSGGIYDIGFVICDKKGVIVDEYNAMVEEIVTSPFLMQQAFYHSKIYTQYLPMLSRGYISIKPWRTIEDDLRYALSHHKVSVMCAYNLAFDAKVISGMVSDYGTCLPVLPSSVKTLDLWALACMTKLNTIRYRELAELLGWKSDAGNFLTNAECAYRFLSEDHSFVENHTALSDCIIESFILSECLKSKVKLPYDQIIANPWKLVNGHNAKGDFRK